MLPPREAAPPSCCQRVKLGGTWVWPVFGNGPPEGGALRQPPAPAQCLPHAQHVLNKQLVNAWLANLQQ